MTFNTKLHIKIDGKEVAYKLRQVNDQGLFQILLDEKLLGGEKMAIYVKLKETSAAAPKTSPSAASPLAVETKNPPVKTANAQAPVSTPQKTQGGARIALKLNERSDRIMGLTPLPAELAGRNVIERVRQPSSPDNYVFKNEALLHEWVIEGTDTVTKLCELPPTGETKSKSRVIEGPVTITPELDTMKKIATLKNKEVTYLGFRNLIEELGKLTKEEGFRLAFVNGKDEPTGEYITSTASPICNWENISWMHTYRYAKWLKIMTDIGLGKYFKLAIKDDGYADRNIQLGTVWGDVMKEIRAAYPHMSDYNALLEAAKEPRA